MSNERNHDVPPLMGSVGDLFHAIRNGEANSRAMLAQRSGLAPSTISLRIDTLLRLGLIEESGGESSRGGRRARKLTPVSSAGFVAALDVGANHVKVALVDLMGQVIDTQDQGPAIEGQPEALVSRLWDAVQTMISQQELNPQRLMGIALGLPAPIEHASGRVVLPSFMPSLHDAVIPDYFAEYTHIPVLVDNDANLVALAERSTEHPESDQLLAIKLGTRIGCGILAAGKLHRGIGGAAGEISHTAVSGISTISCTCGIPNCLESVASGGALAARLAQAGYDVATAADVVELGRGASPEVVDILREAGSQIGEVLSSIVNFFNPREVVLGGIMSESSALVAAIRAQLFQLCLPLVTNNLEVRAARNPGDAGIKGASILILEEILAPARIESLARIMENDAPSHATPAT